MELKEIIQSLTADMAKHGFKKRGYLFYRIENDVYGLIEFQKGKYATKEQFSFTINLAVYSPYLWNFFTDPIGSFPNSGMAHWRIRPGELMSHKKADHWWQVNDDIDTEALINEIRTFLIDKGIPAVVAHLSEEKLYEAWKKNEYGGMTEFFMLMNLLVLMKKMNDPEFENAVVQFKSRVKNRAQDFEEVAATLRANKHQMD